MERVTTESDIQRPIEAVFAFVTTPAYWPSWHPSSLGVSGATDHSLEVGERVTEESHTEGCVTYTLTPTDAGTHFTREFAYAPPDTVPEAAAVAIRRQVEAESSEAVRRLTTLLEAE